MKLFSFNCLQQKEEKIRIQEEEIVIEKYFSFKTDNL